jgi:hypothetical protein
VRRLVSFPAGLLLAYCILAVASFWTTWGSPTDRWIGQFRDPILFIWSLGWLPFALTHGHDPLVTNQIAYPDGINLLWNTTVPFFGVVLAPLTLLFGAVFSYNVMSTLALALSAWAAYFAFRRYTRDVAAAIGGLLYGFGPFTFAQAKDHPQISFVAFPPLVLLLLDEILVRQRRSPIAMGLLLSVATIVQVLIGEEMGLATVLVAATAVVVFALMHRHEVRAKWPYAKRALGIALAVFVVIGAYPFAVLFFGSGRWHGPAQLPDTFVTDLLGFVIPTRHQEFTTAWTERIANTFTGPSELDAFIGIPLLLLAGYVVVRWWRDPLVRFAAALAVIGAVLSLGPRLHVEGHSLPVRLPWVVPQRIPLLDSILPARLAVFVLLAIALLVAVFIDRVQLPRLATAAIVAVAFLPAFPNLPFPWQPAAVPPFFDHNVHLLPNDSVAIIAPPAGLASATARPMLWQVHADFRFKMPGAYAITGPQTQVPVMTHIDYILHEQKPPALTRQYAHLLRCSIVGLRARTVVVGPMRVGHRAIVELFRTLLQRPPEQIGGVQLWRNADALARDGAGSCA